MAVQKSRKSLKFNRIKLNNDKKISLNKNNFVKLDKYKNKSLQIN